MRIAHLLPGTGSFHCGTCLRDQALLQALRARGHEVTVVPMYLPSYPPEPGEQPPVQMGAINLYLQHRLPWWRRLPRFLRNRLDSPRLLRFLSKSGGNTDPANLGAMTVDMLRGEAGPFAAEIERLRQWFLTRPPYNVIALSNVLLCGVVRSLRSTGAAIACTMQGESSFVDLLPEPHRQRAWQLLQERCAEIDALIAVSRHYRDVMQPRLSVASNRVHVVPNGLRLRGIQAMREPPTTPTLGYLARMTAAKGLPLLVDAFLLLHARGTVPGLRLRIAGVMRGEDRPLVEQLRARLHAAGAADRVEFLPNLEEVQKAAFLRSLTVFSVPADDDESFGLYVLEAMAEGVPVVQPKHAAFPEILAHGGGLLCAPKDAASLADGIASVCNDPARATQLGHEGQLAVQAHFTAARMAFDVEAVYATLSRTKASPRP